MTRARDVANVLSTATSLATDTETAAAISSHATTENGHIPSQSGNSGKYLTTNGSTASWGTVSSGGMTLISTTSISGVTTTLNSIPQTYNNLILIFEGLTSSGNYNLRVRCNNDTTSNAHITSGINTPLSGSAAAFDIYSNIWWLNRTTSSASTVMYSYLIIPNYTSASIRKAAKVDTVYYNPNGSDGITTATLGYITGSSITRLDIIEGTSVGFTGGTVKLYGVN